MNNINVKDPQYQVATGKNGAYQLTSMLGRSMRLKAYRAMANKPELVAPSGLNDEELEQEYWASVNKTTPLYGAGVGASLMEGDVWNFNELGTILDHVQEDYGISIEGVNTPFLYFGMWKTSFAWHSEDVDLYSLNMLHFGSPKTWYAVPPQHAFRLEKLASELFPASHEVCPAFLRHKMTMLSPALLNQHGIPFDKVGNRSYISIYS